MSKKQNGQGTFSINRRQAIVGLLTASAGLSGVLVPGGVSFAAVSKANVQKLTPKKLKATMKTSQVNLKKQKLRGKTVQTTLQSYTPETNTQAAPLAATAAEATFTKYPVKTTADPFIEGMTKGDTGSDFWFTESEANRIGKITTQGAITEYKLPPSGRYAEKIANGPDDTFWFTYTVDAGKATPNYLGRIVGARGKVTLYVVPGSEVVGDFEWAEGIVRGSDDKMWFTTYKGKVGNVTDNGTITLYTLGNGNYAQSSIATGPDKALWFDVAGSAGVGIGRMTTSGDYTFYSLPDMKVGDITTGRNNDLWFTGNSHTVNRITTSGQLTRYYLPNNADPSSIAHLGNGTFAFGAETGSTPFIGTITPTGDINFYEAPVLAGDMVYAGWANEIWFTTRDAIYKFRLDD
jgi:virginiamycin B lyase